MVDLSRRVAETLQRLQTIHREQTVFLVTHADWIRAAGANVSGASLDVCNSYGGKDPDNPERGWV